MQTAEVQGILDEMAEALKALLKKEGISNPAMIGIHTGGAWIAQELHRRLQIPDALGTLDITFYRDDFTRIGIHPQVKPSNLPFPVDNRPIILVDDVLYTGRTIRAALNEIFDYGRPAMVILAVLLDRNGRELPIQASVVGRHMDLSSDEQATLHGPAPLTLTITRAHTNARKESGYE